MKRGKTNSHQPANFVLGGFGLSIGAALLFGTMFVQAQILPPERPILAAGRNHALALRADGTVWAWGTNDFGQLGRPTNLTVSPYPVRVPNVTNAIGVAAGTNHSLAVLADGRVLAWGQGDQGQLGNGATTNSASVVEVTGVSNAVAVAAGDRHSLVLLANGTVRCWGDNSSGQLGNNTTPTDSSSPVSLVGSQMTNIVAIEGGGWHSLALRGDGTVWSWGENGSGQLGIGSFTDQAVPVQVLTLTNAFRLAAGLAHNIVVSSNGQVWVWGENGNGELGLGTTVDTNQPTHLSTVSNAVAAAAGDFGSIILLANGSSMVWAFSGFAEAPATPLWMDRAPVLREVAQGNQFCLGATPDGQIWSWGLNSFGQLGNGTLSDSLFNQAPVFAFSATAKPRAGRFARRWLTRPEFTSFVLPLDQQKGVRLPDTGDEAYQWNSAKPWPAQIQRTPRRHLQNTISQSSTQSLRFEVENPIAGFGTGSGGTPLHLDTSFSFGVYAGGLDERDTTSGATNAFRIAVYARSNFVAGTNNIAPFFTTNLTVPRRTVAADSNAWVNFATNGFSKTVEVYGLKTKLEFVDGQTNGKPWGLRWQGSPLANFILAGCKLTHEANTNATNYYFLIEGLGMAQAGSSGSELILLGEDTNGVWSPLPLYSLDFEARPPLRPAFVVQPHFEGEPLPPEYAGKSRLELEGLVAAVTNQIWITNASYQALDTSPELRGHPLLEQLVSDLRGDPLALASYVINEIELADPLGVSGPALADVQSVHEGGVNRGALGTYLERQGSPTEQCALLVYLLRRAGYFAAYVFPTNNNLKLLDSRLSKLLRVQVRGTAGETGYPWLSSRLVPVHYPWVVVNLGTNQSVQIFPWLKDTEITEGLDLYDYLPAAYDSAFQWVKEFVYGNTNILALAPESNAPLILFPKFIEQQLRLNPSAAGFSLDEFGVRFRNRKNQFARWEDLPRPNVLKDQTQVAVVDTLSASPATFPFLTNLFNTLRVAIYKGSSAAGSAAIDSGELRMADLHNRKFLLFTNTPTTLRLWLAPHRSDNTNGTTSDFASDAALTNKQQITYTMPNGGTNFTVRFIHQRQRTAVTNWVGFLAAGATLQVTNDRPYLTNDMAALVFNVGRVTQPMLRVHAESFWHLERARAANTNSVPLREEYEGTAAYLLGMGYYEKENRFAELNERLHKVSVLSRFDAGLAKMTARRTNSTLKTQGGVDMPHRIVVAFADNSRRPDLGEEQFSLFDNFWWLNAANSSAEEHKIINTTLEQTNSISTVKLLQLAQQRSGPSKAAIVELNSKDYAAKGEFTYTGYGATKLKDQDAGMWSSIVTAFSGWDAHYTRVFITPGPVDAEGGAYKGMGALIVGENLFAALISGNQVPNSGGAGSYISPFTASVAPPSPVFPFSLNQSPGGDFSFHDTSLNLAFDQSVFSLQIATFNSVNDSFYSPGIRALTLQSDLFYESTFTPTLSLQSTASDGFFGLPNWLTTQNSTVADPVNILSGEFYIDATDLTLPGPFPLQLRRNYLSQNLSDGQFGYGWKINFVPYLVINTNASNVAMILAAEMDGSVVAYRLQTNDLWTVDLRDNPTLNNHSTHGIGSTANWLNARLQRFTNGLGVISFRLTGPDGSERLFEERDDFGVLSLDRVRPYLTSWSDHRGNFLRFFFGLDAGSPDFGQLARIEAGNGNFLGLHHDVYGHVIEAFTGDGRRLSYTYSEEGDLVKVTFPDGSEHRYEYERRRETFDSASWFSSVANTNHVWLYQYAGIQGNTMTRMTNYSAASQSWFAFVNNGVPSVAADLQQPGQNNDSVRTFRAPHAGSISVTSVVQHLGATGDGVRIRIRKNNSANLLGWTTVAAGASHNFGDTETVNAGDYLHFQVNRNANTNADLVRWDVAVSYTTGVVASTHLLVREFKPDGRALENRYDSLRRVINQAATAGADLNLVTNAVFAYTNNARSLLPLALTGTTTVKDVFGNPTTYTYSNSLITKIAQPLGLTIEQYWYADNATAPGYRRGLWKQKDARGLWTEYQYDVSGNVTNRILSGADLTGDGVTNVTFTSLYDTNLNLVLETTDPASNRVQFIYSTNYPYLVERLVRWAGATTVSTNQFFYGNASNVVSDGIFSRTNQAFGLLQREVRAGGATNEWTHDGRGFAIEQRAYPKTADGLPNNDPAVITQLFYNDRSELVERTDGAGRKTRLDYDAMSRPEWREVFDESGQRVAGEYSYYNENGELTWQDGPRFDPEDYVWRDHDGAGRKIMEIRWRSRGREDGGGVESESGDDLFATTRYEHDPFGNLLRMVNPRGVATTNAWDALGRLTRRVVLETDGSLLSTEGFGYEPGGQVAFHTNALGSHTETQFTTTGQPRRRINPDGSTNGWRYYPDGRLRREIQSNGAYWETAYHDAARTTTRIFHSSSGTALATNVMEQDGRGNLVRRVDAAGFAFTNVFDGLDRLKWSAGPVIAHTLPTNSPPVPGAPPPPTQQATTNYFDAAGLAATNLNALGEKTITFSDALGRVTRSEIRDKSNNLIRLAATSYAANHHSATTTSGSGASALVSTTFTDNDGQPVLSFRYPGASIEFDWQSYDVAGNRTASRACSWNNFAVTIWTTNGWTYDGLNRVQTATVRDGATTAFSYDAAGNLTNRAMPGGLTWRATYNSASQRLLEYDLGAGGLAARTNSYTYFGSSSPYAGLLQTRTDGRGVVCAYAYDDWLRAATNVHTGSMPEQNLTTLWHYDARGFLTNVTESFASTNTGPSIFIRRSYNAYGSLQSELIFTNGAVASLASQSWDSAGRRSGLGYSAFGYTFTWRPDGLLSSTAGKTGGGVYSYNDAGLLVSRTIGARTTTIGSRDGTGRPLAINTTIAGVSKLAEELVWSGDGLPEAHTMTRENFTDSRAYFYAGLSRRLTEERLDLDETTRWTNSFVYDKGLAGGPGVLTQAGAASTNQAQWSGSGDAFGRAGSGTNNVAARTAHGRVNGSATVLAWLDGRPMPVSVVGTGDTTWTNTWRATLEMTPGAHQLMAIARHPSGLFTTNATIWFTNNLGKLTETNGFDPAGNLVQRVWRNPDGTTNRWQTFTWDARGRLFQVSDRLIQHSNTVAVATNGLDFTATYDAFGRLLRTAEVILTNSIALSNQPVVVAHYYDPQVEFLEVGVSENGRTSWKLLGPDMDGVYGGQNGTGGFDAFIPGPELFCPILGDAFGNLHAVYDQTHSNLTWYPSRVTGYGAVPGYRPVPLGQAGADLGAKTAWRNRAMTSIGYVWMGGTWLKPDTGETLSFDPYGHDSSDTGHTPFNGNPIGYHWDPDGRQGIIVAHPTAADYARRDAEMYWMRTTGRPFPPEPPAWAIPAANRITGSLGLIGSAIETTIGVLASEAVVGVPVAIHGADGIFANAHQIWTGESQRTLTAQAITSTAEGLGASPQAAHYWGTGVDIAASLGSGFVRTGPAVTTTWTTDLLPGNGFTDKFGNMTMSSLGTDLDRSQVALHEGMHSAFAPAQSSLFGPAAANLRISLYQDSQLYRYGGEALAETVAQMGTRSLSGFSTREALSSGLSFPFNPHYGITAGGLAQEGAAATAGLVGAGTGLYLWNTAGANVTLSKH
jgi:YD repeat-containing protein